MKLKSILLGGAIALAGAPALADDILRMATSFQIRSMDPVSQGFWMQEFGQGELLMQFQPDGTITPWLAESLELTDGTTWVITIRDSVTFQNGRAMDVPAVLEAIEYHRERNSGTQAVLPAEATFTQTGEREITVETGVPVPELPSILAHESRLMIIDVGPVLAAGEDYEALEGAGIHTGPYMLTDLDDQRMIAVRYDDYWQGTPAMAGVELRFVSDVNARILAVQNGEVDIALYPPIAAAPVFAVTPNTNLALGAPSTGGFLSVMDVTNGAFEEIAVRRAVMLAVSYEELANDVFHGAKIPATSLYNPRFPWAVKNYRYDVDEANAILDEAGWVHDGDTRTRDGETLSVTLMIYPQQPDLVPLSTAMQAYLAAIGIQSEIVSVDNVTEATMNDLVEWDLAMVATGTATVGSVSGFLNRYVACEGDRNYGGYCNDRVQELIETLDVTVDEEARYEMLREIQTILVDEDPYVFNATILIERALVSDAWSNYVPAVAWNHVKFDTAPNE
ncbi:ABC transporter substrate-binding protein [Roseobacter sp. HKCCD9010]|uniref:ABC transporter substrate-binding protein n=1 Tax=unclassified Roseobacter TaxID=196798 RepID=UPI0014929451|nr:MULTISPECIES: ABC transporter substrate-binding protein [unclassified Roseobacter]MBF9052107.1 ABC transporter substrate-binding protein [Rhodobacterales bacterium HKCCD4356]NNV14244.1 ABC transporter substrate-binding protein [Roseobacter sp. HKCCD7357]NNV18628.1 ABC transporter substrate-binding protein [Roseobacter sp. HKCCD8768]NNV28065.1 ABC transporter substrate-binding protein [Roseobacter sp. HKCCD8192]NNV32358.1 ABC transporter substrate-binding protein [Roseobacter sp. HKCCD9061]